MNREWWRKQLNCSEFIPLKCKSSLNFNAAAFIFYSSKNLFFPPKNWDNNAKITWSAENLSIRFWFFWYSGFQIKAKNVGSNLEKETPYGAVMPSNVVPEQWGEKLFPDDDGAAKENRLSSRNHTYNDSFKNTNKVIRHEKCFTFEIKTRKNNKLLLSSCDHRLIHWVSEWLDPLKFYKIKIAIN